jgi:hypothetical protein
MKHRLFPVQPKLPHVPEPTHADIKALVCEKLHGFKYRQAARDEKRRKQNERSRPASGPRPDSSIELSESYWKDSVSYCKGAEMKISMPTLFDMDRQKPE